MKIRALVAGFSLAVVLGACTAQPTLPTPVSEAPVAADAVTPSAPLHQSSETGGGMGSGN